ncbi:MAG: hypothetical protein AB1899_01710 [Pseudomonadota bacterium]
MSDDGNGDLFGKIDALFGKRAPDALREKGLEYDDFPLLTEVVTEDQPQGWTGGERQAVDRRRGDRRQGDRRVGERLLAEPPAPLPAHVNAEMARLVAAMEQRLIDMFIRQQLRVEDAVRKAIREELGRKDGAE